MPGITGVHDKFFQESFSHKEIAKSFLDHYLPSEIRGKIDLDTLNIVKDSFVDKELEEHFSDILYTAKWNKDLLLNIYLLFEHKSYPDPMSGFQLIRYIVKIWEHYRRQQPKRRRLPPIFPMIIYQGKAKWRISNQFHDFVELDDGGYLAKYIPGFQYKVYDISHLPDDQIRGELLGRAVLLVAKHIFQPELREKLPGILSLLQNMTHRETTLEMLEVLLRYVVRATQQFDENDIVEILRKAEIGEDIMQTFIDKYVDQGMQQGMQQGMRQGMQQGEKRSLLRMLEARFGAVPEWARRKVRAAEMDMIEKWGLRMFSADNLNDLLKD